MGDGKTPVFFVFRDGIRSACMFHSLVKSNFISGANELLLVNQWYTCLQEEVFLFLARFAWICCCFWVIHLLTRIFGQVLMWKTSNIRILGEELWNSWSWQSKSVSPVICASYCRLHWIVSFCWKCCLNRCDWNTCTSNWMNIATMDGKFEWFPLNTVNGSDIGQQSGKNRDIHF